MGVVYLADDPEIERPVAVKTLREMEASPAARSDLEARFLKEAKLAGRLQHPNVVTVYEVGREQDVSFIAMEYVDGESLEPRGCRGRRARHRGAARDRAAGRARAPARARARRRAPGHQAGQHPRDEGPAGEGRRLRNRKAPVGRHRRPDAHRADAGQPRLHVPRADPRRKARRPLRPVLSRRGFLRAADRVPPLPGRLDHDARLPDPPHGAARPPRVARGPASGHARRLRAPARQDGGQAAGRRGGFPARDPKDRGRAPRAPRTRRR